MNHTLSILVENESGVLIRIAGLFARRGYNIESLSVGRSEKPTVSRITFVVPGDTRTIGQLTKQLYKLVNVEKVQDLTIVPNVERELMIMRIEVNDTTRPKILDLVSVFNAKIVDFTTKTLTLERTGEPDKISSFEVLIGEFKIIEMTKTGVVSLIRDNELI